jgi:hypothetical protein
VGAMQVIISSVMSIFSYALVVAAVWKLFQIGNDLGEIKTILTDLRRAAATPAALPALTGNPAPSTTPPPVLAGPISIESAEALLREVAVESQVREAAEPPKTAV